MEDGHLWIAVGSLVLSIAGLILHQYHHVAKDAKWQGKVEQALRDRGIHLNGGS